MSSIEMRDEETHGRSKTMTRKYPAQQQAQMNEPLQRMAFLMMPEVKHDVFYLGECCQKT